MPNQPRKEYWLICPVCKGKTRTRGQEDTVLGNLPRFCLRRLAHEEGRCVIVVTHDPEAADSADLVLRMKDGVLTAA